MSISSGVEQLHSDLCSSFMHSVRKLFESGNEAVIFQTDHGIRPAELFESASSYYDQSHSAFCSAPVIFIESGSGISLWCIYVIDSRHQHPVLKFQSANTDWRKHSFIFHNSSPFHNSTFTSFFLIYNISSTGIDVYFLFVMHTILFSKMCLSFPQRSKRLRFREPRSCIRSRDGQQYFQNTRSCEGILSSQHHKLFFVNIYNRESL